MTIYFQLPDSDPDTLSRVQFLAHLVGDIQLDAAPVVRVDLGSTREDVTLFHTGESNLWEGVMSAKADFPALSLRFLSQAPPLSDAPYLDIFTIVYEYTPPRPAQGGVWPLRQRQCLLGPGSWPLRQRQHGAHTGSWPLRQRQTGT